MTRTLRPGFDRHVSTPAFAVTFRDRAAGDVVWDGLRVELSDSRRPGRAQRLTPNPHGVFVAHAVRGLGADFTSPPATRRFNLTVSDPLGRYVPLRMDADLPVDGLFRPACLETSPPGGDRSVPLFSASTRALPAGLAMVRADLRLASNPEAPASWARLELVLDGQVLAEGVADARGVALLLGPLPPLTDPPLHSSPPRAEPLLWEVTLRTYWRPGLANVDVPDLCELLGLPEVTPLEWAIPPRPLGPQPLEAGVPLVVHSLDSSFLFVSA